MRAGYRCREAKCGRASQLGRTDYQTDLNVPGDAAFYLHDKDEHDEMCTFAQADRMQRLWLCGPEGREGSVLAQTAGLCGEHWWCVLMLLPT